MTLTIDFHDALAKDGVVRITRPRLTDAELNDFRRSNPHVRIERSDNGDILVLPTTTVNGNPELPDLSVNMARVFQDTP